MKIRKLFAAGAVALGVAMGGGAAHAAVVNLGFAIDHSGSMSDAGYTLQKQGLANALALLAADDLAHQYNISVITFGDDVKTLVSPTIVTAGNIAAIQAAITGHNRTNTGSTQTGAAINQLVTNFNGHDIAGRLTLFNISTDGVPCCQGNAQALAVTAAGNAISAGVNGISVELVNQQTTGVANMLQIVRPGPGIHITDVADLPNPALMGFVLTVPSFAEYAAAIGAKIEKITTVDPPVIPLPATLPLLMGGMAMFAGLRLRRKHA